jgi:hypothetical protein
VLPYGSLDDGRGCRHTKWEATEPEQVLIYSEHLGFVMQIALKMPSLLPGIRIDHKCGVMENNLS